ncbi:MAG: uroporphyrinogen-III synthase [Bauldia sp.]|nr:uroporphyrinogen-III synthase [Bauldia sp.]MCW5716380.1 uroporphyrinogen-III synthase [Bauldia sp.]
MRLLVTRPQPDANRTATRLRALGHAPLVQPMLSPEYLHLDIPGVPGAIVVTSRNGVRALAFLPNAARWTRVPLFAVGAATAAAARQAGFADVRSADGDSMALADLISATLDPAVGDVLYPAAENRRPDLERILPERGFALRVAVAYRMCPAEALATPVRTALAGREIDGILLYSARTAVIFAGLVAAAGLNDALAEAGIYAISRATADAAAWPDPSRLRIAAEPTEEAILALLGGSQA